MTWLDTEKQRMLAEADRLNGLTIDRHEDGPLLVLSGQWHDAEALALAMQEAVRAAVCRGYRVAGHSEWEETGAACAQTDMVREAKGDE